MPDGFLILDKPAGPTSHDMVYFVRRGTGERRVGHAGTLDPLATGVLVTCLGSATRLSEYLLGESKRYRVTARFGVATSTYDSQGEATAERPVTANQAELEAALAAYRGEQLQTPPAFSAVKRGGRKAYELARRGEATSLEPRPVTIYELRLEDWQPPEAVLSVHCSAGTYVRSLVHDLGQALGCGAHVAALRRTASGHFDLGRTVTQSDLATAFGDGSWTRHLLSARQALPTWPLLKVEARAAGRLRHGQAVVDDDAIRLDLPSGSAGQVSPLALAYGDGGQLIAIVEHDPRAGAWRPVKVLAAGG